MVPTNSTSPTAEQWEALRQCESGGNYQAVSPSGRYRGAYQFSRSTWNWLAGSIGSTHLVDADPAAASQTDQDQMAAALWERQGWQPWPACSKKLGFR
ncbi:MAG: transglycosylase family protein [Acidimicrobiaceae bacterium]|nr:transglycosylase family protein [Acidimicrobiaceae bacterium]